ncbi:MAG TPA: FKBP-type peptidyl-prolyl cis-trans isomerase [Opitutaceae bacterium]|nr:FKBP-type peptidyl-prolyl cis-trans isomerase [Opitutaceae bacterium]
MKLKFLLSLGLLGLGAVAVASAEDIKLTVPGQPAAAAPAPAAPAAPAATYSEPQILEVIGWFMGKNAQIDTFDFSKDQLDAVVRGFSQAAAGKDSPTDIQKIGPQVEDFVHKRQDAYLAKLKTQGLADTAKFFADLKKKPGIVALPSGLYYEITKPGSGPNAKATDTVKAHYTGTLINGTVFDTSRQPRQPGDPVTPAEFALDQVIPGWTEGLQKINKGGMIKLYIPPQLAYGDEGRPGIPPASTLIFDIEVLDITPTPGPASLTPAIGTGK